MNFETGSVSRYLPSSISIMTATLVTFTPGARTNWHTHKTRQVLVATQGTGMVQVRGGPPHLLRAGECGRGNHGQNLARGDGCQNQQVKLVPERPVAKERGENHGAPPAIAAHGPISRKDSTAHRVPGI